MVEIIGKKVINIDETNSTNIFAEALCQNQIVDNGTVVFANYQTGGKGQGTNKWLSEKNENILMSIILYPEFVYAHMQFYLSIAISLSIAHTIRQYSGKSTHIKWSNDILLNKKKIAGILIKNTLGSNKLKKSIVGIGINVNQATFDQQLPFATSLAIEEKQMFELDQFKSVLLSNLNYYYRKLEGGKLDYLKMKYEEQLYLMGDNANLLLDNSKMMKGKILGVESTGELKVEIDQKIYRYNYGQIKIMYG